jgi:hypothetical protein
MMTDPALNSQFQTESEFPAPKPRWPYKMRQV